MQFFIVLPALDIKFYLECMLRVILENRTQISRTLCHSKSIFVAGFAIDRTHTAYRTMLSSFLIIDPYLSVTEIFFSHLRQGYHLGTKLEIASADSKSSTSNNICGENESHWPLVPWHA